MPDYLILKQDTDATPIPWQPVQIAQSIETQAELKDVVTQGYTGPGRYRVVRWDNGKDFDMQPGPIKVTDAPPPEPELEP